MLSARSLLGTLAAAMLTLGTAAAALAADEAPGTPVPTDPPEGLTWQLREQVVDGSLAAVPGSVVVTLLLRDGQASGSGGCNQYSGEYTLDDPELSFGPITSTLMACEGPAGDTEAAYFTNLAATAAWSSDRRSLTLKDAAGSSILVFDPAADAPLPVEGIEGITWHLTSYVVGGDAVAGVPDDVVAWLELEGGQATGNAGCNGFFGGYTLDGAAISFEPLASTLMLCEGPGGEVEMVFLTALESVAGWSSDGSQLTLTDAAGNALLLFAPGAEVGLGGSWIASGINDGQGGVVTSQVTADVTATFDPSGELSGFDGCNRYRTTYITDGEGITVSPEIASTRMACPSDEHSAQSAQYATALVAATTWTITPEGRLELRDDSGALQVGFVPAAG